MSLINCLLSSRIFLLGTFFVAFHLNYGQTANLVRNGSFEEITNCNSTNNAVNHWTRVDTSKPVIKIHHECIGNVPGSTSSDFQYPRTGQGFVGGTFYCIACAPLFRRAYYRTALKSSLNTSNTYCVKFFVNVRNYSKCGIDGMAAYFGDTNLDTIKYGDIPLSYLNPQVSNPDGNFLLDTLNWVAISGTFIAQGTEKYLVIGNFKSDQATGTASISSTNCSGSDYLVDDVSVFDINTPAFAGNDTAIVPGDSAFIGRTPDVGIDEACQWFKWPNMTTAIDTVAGLWVKPVTTTTYIVRQQLWCSGVKWDTVVVHMNPVGFSDRLKTLNDQLTVYPVPANDQLELRIANAELMKDFNALIIYNHLGAVVKEEELRFDKQTFIVNVGDLPQGIYSLQLKNKGIGTVRRKFVVER